MRVSQIVEVEVTGQDLYDEIKKRFDVGDYSLIDGVLHRYERVSWDDYDNVVVSDLKEDTVERITDRLVLLDQLKDTLNECRNPYKEPNSIN